MLARIRVLDFESHVKITEIYDALFSPDYNEPWFGKLLAILYLCEK